MTGAMQLEADHGMITVAGEALIDIVIGASGSITALPVALRSTSRERSRDLAEPASSSASSPMTRSVSSCRRRYSETA